MDESSDCPVLDGAVKVLCRAIEGDLIKVGYGIKGFKPFPVRLRVGQDREEAARQHKRFKEVVALAASLASGESYASISIPNALAVHLFA